MDIDESLRFCNYDEKLLAVGTFYMHEIEIFEEYNVRSIELGNIWFFILLKF